MNPFEMVVLIILIVTIGKVASARFGNCAGRHDRARGKASLAVDDDAVGRNEPRIVKSPSIVVRWIARLSTPVPEVAGPVSV